jgi:uncharacterized membrane protein YeiH
MRVTPLLSPQMPVGAALPLLLLRGGTSIPADPPQELQEAIVSFTMYLGTAMSAISGTISAGTKQMDMLGCVVVSCVTAIGGGTIRDVILGRPPFWLTFPKHLHLCVVTSVLMFLIWPQIVNSGFKDTNLAFLWSDAIGMAASTVFGAHIGLIETGQWSVGVMSGLVTAVFGGIVRDVLCLEPPRALYAERSMYATPALLGAAVYVALRMLRTGSTIPYLEDWMVASVPFLIALFVRAAAWTYRLALPRWARKSTSFGIFRWGEELGFELSPAQGGDADEKTT